MDEETVSYKGWSIKVSRLGTIWHAEAHGPGSAMTMGPPVAKSRGQSRDEALDKVKADIEDKIRPEGP
jgi:hypothetical protein